MNFHIVTIFPDMFVSYFSESIISRAIENKIINLNTYALREYTTDKHRRVDGKPYAGGPGMVMWVEPIINNVEKIKEKIEKRILKENSKIEKLESKTGKKIKRVKSKLKIVILSPGAKEFTNSVAKETADKYTDVIFICGRYEGIDARVKKILKAEEWTVGPYILTGGELPAMICIDAISRQIKGVLHDEESIEENRVSSHEIYGRPEIFKHKNKNYKVPAVLLSGNHKLIEEWKISTKDSTKEK